MHLTIYEARPDIKAVVHAHPPYSTILAIMNLEIPPIHYMIACAGGDTIRYAAIDGKCTANGTGTCIDSDLGDNAFRRFLRITLPLSAPGVIGAAMFVPFYAKNWHPIRQHFLNQFG